MIVSAPIYDEFVAALADEASKLHPGDPVEEADGTYAPLSSRTAAENLDALVADAVSKGATLHAGGRLEEGSTGAYYAPAVLTGVTPAMRAYREELFEIGRAS